MTAVGPSISTIPPCDGDVTYQWTYTDCANNSFVWTYTFTIDDNTPPTLIVPADRTVANGNPIYVNQGCVANNPALGQPIKSDNCSVSGLLLSNDGPENFPLGLTLVTWWLEDCAGNVATGTQWVEVVHNTLSGTVNYNNAALTPMNNVSLTINPAPALPQPQTITTDGSGNYSFGGLCEGNYTLTATTIKPTNGAINATDAAKVSQYIVNLKPPIEAAQWLAGDANNNAAITGGDAGLIVSTFVNGGGIFPPATSWNFYWQGFLTNTQPALPMPIHVVAGLNNADIYGQAEGDFNSSFTPNNAKSSFESLTLSYGDYLQVTPDVEFELPLYAAMEMEVGAASLIMNFPSDIVEITDVFLTSDPSSSLLYNVSGNELRIGWFSSEPVLLNEGDGLITLQMKLNSSTTGDGIHFDLTSDPLNELADGSYDVINDAVLEIGVPTTTFLGIGNNLAENLKLRAQPNPFNGTTTLIYTVPANGQVTLEIYDMVGNKVQVAVDQTLSAGNYSLRLDAGSLQPGVYTAYLKLHNADNTVTRTIKLISR
jgi:hypothetical protein